MTDQKSGKKSGKKSAQKSTKTEKAAPRVSLPARGRDWETIREEMQALGQDDADWRSGRTAVYVFHPGDDVIQVAKDAYALYQSENALGPAAFPSLRQMEADVISMGKGLLHGDEQSCGNMTSGGTDSIKSDRTRY